MLGLVPRLPRIKCAKCRKWVKGVVLEADTGFGNQIRITVYCHGDTDTMEIPAEVMDDSDTARQILSQTGTAFTTLRVAKGV